MAYEYTDPTKQGYVKFKLTHKEHNSIIIHRKVNMFTKIEAYYKENIILIHYFTNALGKIISTLLLPITFIVHGLASTKEIIHDLKRLYNEKKYGAFVSEHICSKNFKGVPNKRFQQLERIYERQTASMQNGCFFIF